MRDYLRIAVLVALLCGAAVAQQDGFCFPDRFSTYLDTAVYYSGAQNFTSEGYTGMYYVDSGVGATYEDFTNKATGERVAILIRYDKGMTYIVQGQNCTYSSTHGTLQLCVSAAKFLRNATIGGDVSGNFYSWGDSGGKTVIFLTSPNYIPVVQRLTGANPDGSNPYATYYHYFDVVLSPIPSTIFSPPSDCYPSASVLPSWTGANPLRTIVKRN